MVLTRFRKLFAVLTVLSVAVALLSVGVAGLVGRGAQLVQLVQPAAADVNALFGESGPGTPIGSPQVLIVRDPRAFMEGRAEGGARYVSDTYLKAQNIYPLQLKTVTVIRNVLLAVALVAALLFGGLWLWAGRRSGTRTGRTVGGPVHLNADK
ncbi:hypothetical protein [Deinococcus altitudinis]|uniref:hypothetical protein n=1 Tax=Deinococcus altitudinis TaxID=468914 RepID=UPI0038920870